ncbi:GRF1-interacting factor 3 [Heracleum sosnowskyi]|uniref:GRF1-interacting factor 3 n=1 Tax=Heracleum sosnowskyi TaxID=360622 RepID=A0AAD8IXZ7_9APIA|nr:GRF1-interacting factor 3 [Heracleum sosnowskyi]
MQQPPPSSMKPAPPSKLVSTEQIQKYLEENKNLILAILEHQNQGKVAECNQLQAVLQKNLMNLAAIADAQPPPSGPSQVPPSSVAQQGNYMQSPQGPMMQQQQGGSGISKVPKANAPRSQEQQQQQQQQQLLHFQQQQQIYGQMAMRAGANNGMHGMNQMMQHGMGTSGSLMDARGIKKDSPEAASSDGQRKYASGRVRTRSDHCDGTSSVLNTSALVFH